MSFAFVASTSKGFNQSGVTSDAINTTGANLLIVSVGWYSDSATGFTGIPVVTDSKGNTWTGLNNQYSADGNFVREKLYYSAGATVGSGHTFTVSGITSDNGYPIMSVVAVSGAHASPLDQQSGAGLNSTAGQPGSITPTESNCLLVTGVTSGGLGYSIDGGFTAEVKSASGGFYLGGGLAYLIQTSAVAANPTWSWTGLGQAATSMASFKPAAGGGGTPALLKQMLQHTQF